MWLVKCQAAGILPQCHHHLQDYPDYLPPSTSTPSCPLSSSTIPDWLSQTLWEWDWSSSLNWNLLKKVLSTEQQSAIISFHQTSGKYRRLKLLRKNWRNGWKKMSKSEKNQEELWTREKFYHPQNSLVEVYLLLWKYHYLLYPLQL